MQETYPDLETGTKDIGIPQSMWDRYLTKYQKKYHVKRDEIGVYRIQTYKSKSDVEVQLYSLERAELTALFDFKSQRGMNILKNKMPSYCRIGQEGDIGCNIIFPEDKLEALDNLGVIHLKHRTILSEEEHQRRVELGKKMAAKMFGSAAKCLKYARESVGPRTAQGSQKTKFV